MVRIMHDAENMYPEMDTRSVTPVSITVPNVSGVLRQVEQRLAPSKGLETLILNQGIGSYPMVWSHMQPEVSGHIFSSGGSGWALVQLWALISVVKLPMI